MAYDDAKKEAGKEILEIVELDLDTCSLTYGNSPCTASGPAAKKCFNTFFTCQDQVNYDKSTKTFRFSNMSISGLQSAGESPTFPTIRNLSHSLHILHSGNIPRR